MYQKLIFILILALAASAAHAANPTADAVGKWKLANTTYTDSSGSGYTLTASGTPTAAAGHNGGTALATACASASSQYLTINDNAGLSITGNLSISVWVKLTTKNVYQMFATKWGASGAYSYALYVNSGNAVVFRVSANGTALTTAQSSTALTTAVWYHIVGVYNGTDLRIYINGALDGSPVAHTTGIYDGTQAFQIGNDNTSGGLYLNGVIDDVAIWNRALSSIEVATLYTYLDDFTMSAVISGTLRDTSGAAIDCSIYNVRVAAYNTTTAVLATTNLITAANGVWSITVPTTDLYNVSYWFVGDYPPTEAVNISGSKIMAGE